jgi:hypothetical protein
MILTEQLGMERYATTLFMEVILETRSYDSIGNHVNNSNSASIESYHARLVRHITSVASPLSQSHAHFLL